MLGKAKKFALYAASALAMMHAPAHAATITIKVGASPSLASSLVDVIGTFQAYYFGSNISYNVAVTVDSNENLKAAIVDGGQSGPYDLILTDDSDVTDLLANSYPALVEDLPFTFAYDRIDLYSTSVDISGGTGLSPLFRGPVVIADPAGDVYGKAASELLGKFPWFITKIPGPRVAVQPNVATAQAGVEGGLYPYGIVPKSSICTNPNGTEVYPEGSYHHEFPPLAGLRYNRIELKGLKLALTAQTADQKTELSDFVNFLNGVGTTQGTDVLKSFCYRLPT